MPEDVKDGGGGVLVCVWPCIICLSNFILPLCRHALCSSSALRALCLSCSLLCTFVPAFHSLQIKQANHRHQGKQWSGTGEWGKTVKRTVTFVWHVMAYYHSFLPFMKHDETDET